MRVCVRVLGASPNDLARRQGAQCPRAEPLNRL